MLGTEGSVRAVTIVALNQALIHAVMKRPGKLGPHIHVARVAKLWCFGFQQELAFLGKMRGVAIDAGDAVRQMHGTVVVAVFLGVLVTPQAAGTGFLWRGTLEGEDFGFVSTAIHMLLARAMTGLAAMPLRPFVSCQF